MYCLIPVLDHWFNNCNCIVLQIVVNFDPTNAIIFICRFMDCLLVITKEQKHFFVECHMRWDEVFWWGLDLLAVSEGRFNVGQFIQFFLSEFVHRNGVSADADFWSNWHSISIRPTQCLRPMKSSFLWQEGRNIIFTTTSWL